ncbi:DUF4209 domain-containing protein [Coleofasciculus sp.]|uniref:DUF4209 domain-containing protein n=1 Tax=Coleofasciculus sp. TaxID=3100458 RepID=UPI003A1CBB71
MCHQKFRQEVLTEDIIFIIKGLLVERMGANIRNEICHGLFDYSQFFQPIVAHFCRGGFHNYRL